MSLPDLSTPQKEGFLQVSKSRKIPLLIDVDEMKSLFDELGSFHIFDVSRPITLIEGEISKEAFLKIYQSYIRALKEGNLPDEPLLRPFFSSVITCDPSAVYAFELPNGKVLLKNRMPVIQMQRHHFIYSDDFYSGVMGEGSITWGIQFSYPQLYIDPKTQEIGKIVKASQFPNSTLFHTLTKWVRNHTSPTPFLVEGKKINQPMRLGKNCFEWINRHPALVGRGLSIQN